MTKQKLCSLVLLLCLLVSVPMFSSAEQVYQLTETQLTTLEQNSSLLRGKLMKLENELERSEVNLQIAQEKLEQYQQESLELQTQLVLSGNKSELLERNLEAVQTSLTKTTVYTEQLEQQVKQLERQNKRERLEKYGVIALLIYELTK